jgi:hypothetical protein
MGVIDPIAQGEVWDIIYDSNAERFVLSLYKHMNQGFIFYSDNTGLSWTSGGFGVGSHRGDIIRSMVYIPSQDVIIGVGAKFDINGVVTPSGGNIWKSEDSGETWTLIHSLSASFPQTQAFSVTHYASGGNGVLLVGTGGNAGIWRSADMGSNWTLADEIYDKDLFGAAYESIVWDFAINDELGLIFAVCGDVGSAWVSDDGGKTWSLDSQIDNSYINSMTLYGIIYDPVTRKLFTGGGSLGGNTAGVWSRGFHPSLY